LKDWVPLAILREAYPLTLESSLEALPDLESLSDQNLRDLIHSLMEQELKVSYERRILHGKIDILRAELQARLKKGVGEGKSPLHEVDVDKLAEILASKATPPAE
jgi:formate dehydrogenase maturation protein FdhE